MGFLEKIRRHAAMASGSFASLFKGVDEIPPLPQTTAQLVTELNQPEPDLHRLEIIFSSTPELAAQVIRTLNSAFFGLRNPVTSIKHALSMLGIDKIRNIALVCATKGIYMIS